MRSDAVTTVVIDLIYKVNRALHAADRLRIMHVQAI